MTEIDEGDSTLPEVVDTGADSVGAGIGAVIGTFLGGPAGAAAGATLGPPLSDALRRVGAEINKRYISPREDQRVASALRYAVERAEEIMETGEEPRDDGFFGGEVDNRSTADEIIEGALIASQREHEERKIEYIGYLIANICFDYSVDRSNSNVLINTAENMNWRQLVVLSYLHRMQEFAGLQDENHIFDTNRVRGVVPPPDDFLKEVSELQRMRILLDLEAFIDFPLDLGKYMVSRLGEQLYSLMELERIADSELVEIHKLCKLGRYAV